MIDRSLVTGLILAGGRGTRMGSVDKGLVLLDRRPLFAHVLWRFGGQVSGPLISVNRNLDEYAALTRMVGGTLVTDRFPDFAGPLAGLHAGLAACATDYLVAVPCDAPFFPSRLVPRLFEALVDDVEVAVAATAVRTHPVFCMMRRDVAPALERHIVDGGRSVHGWLATMRVATVVFPDEAEFRNLNTVEDLHAAAGRT